MFNFLKKKSNNHILIRKRNIRKFCFSRNVNKPVQNVVVQKAGVNIILESVEDKTFSRM